MLLINIFRPPIGHSDFPMNMYSATTTLLCLRFFFMLAESKMVTWDYVHRDVTSTAAADRIMSYRRAVTCNGNANTPDCDETPVDHHRSSPRRPCYCYPCVHCPPSTRCPPPPCTCCPPTTTRCPPPPRLTGTWVSQYSFANRRKTPPCTTCRTQTPCKTSRMLPPCTICSRTPPPCTTCSRTPPPCMTRRTLPPCTNRRTPSPCTTCRMPLPCTTCCWTPSPCTTRRTPPPCTTRRTQPPCMVRKMSQPGTTYRTIQAPEIRNMQACRRQKTTGYLCHRHQHCTSSTVPPIHCTC